MGRQTRGRVTSEGGKPQGSFFEFQEVPPDVLVEVLVEIQHDFRKTSTTVPGSPMRTSSLRTPSPFQLHPDLFRVVQNPLQRNGSGRFYCLALSCSVRDCVSAVLGKVLGIDEQVLGINIRVR